ncbi:SAF domain-containing protein [Thalassobacillus sp. C254]|uniref:SAF domain-containing protein n=1 Tax=Thalassobacillus sp. C254 TaxID=1225341 RepID=UPI0022B734B9|nr:SAF domain-containing protein [Thalassobacillus sp. C254]
MVKGIRQIEVALGSETKQVTSSEEETKEKVRRGIYLNREVKKGHRLSIEDLTYLRPATSIESKHFKDVIGKKMKIDKKAGDPLWWKDLDQEK